MRTPLRRVAAFFLASLCAACASGGGGRSPFRGSLNPSARGAAELSRRAPGAPDGAGPVPGIATPRRPNVAEQGAALCGQAIAGDLPAPAIVDTTVRVTLPRAREQRVAAVSACAVAALSLYGLILTMGP